MSYLTLKTDANSVFKHRHTNESSIRNPEITYTMRISRTATPNLPHTIKLTKINNNKFVLDLNEIKNKTSKFIDDYDVNLFLLNVFFVKNNKKTYPDHFCIKYNSAEFNYYGKCMQQFIQKWQRMFPYPLFLDTNLEIETDENVDVAYCLLLSQPIHIMSHKLNINYWRKNRLLIMSHEKISDITTANGYYTKLFLSSDNFDNVKSITLKSNETYFIEDVPPELLKVEYNLLCISFCFENMAEHGIQIKPESKFLLTFKLNDERIITDITIYGEKHGLLGNYIPDIMEIQCLRVDEE